MTERGEKEENGKSEKGFWDTQGRKWERSTDPPRTGEQGVARFAMETRENK